MLSPVQFELEFPVEVEMLNGGEEQVKNANQGNNREWEHDQNQCNLNACTHRKKYMEIDPISCMGTL